MGQGYRLTSFSNGGPSVDVCAPGQHIYSSIVGSYDYLSGTSMAAPIVSGVAALVLSANALHLLTCSAFSVDADQVLDDASYGQTAAELEGAAPSPAPLQLLFDEAIDAVSPTA